MKKCPVPTIGEKYGRWVVLFHAGQRGPHHYWCVRCACGSERVIRQGSLVSGTSKSCGCLRVDVNAELHSKHGMCDHPAYQSWVAMRRRCSDPGFEGYRYYGGRGITVCAGWVNSFDAFWADMGQNWFEGSSIDRIENDGDYEPGNCRWATDIEQANNKRNNALIQTPWGVMSKADAARRAGISWPTLKHRIERDWPASRWFDPSRISAA